MVAVLVLLHESIEVRKMKFLSLQEPWIDIAEVLGKTILKTHCAIGYIGINAPKILLLKAGDVLVCDASDATVKSGSTYPEALLEYAKIGVSIFSVPGLHAKVLVNGNNAWIGSMNASDSSTSLIEAAVRLENKSTVQAALKFITDFKRVSIPLSESDIERLINLPRRQRPRKTGVFVLTSLEFPSDQRSLKLLRTESDAPLSDSQRQKLRATRRQINEQSEDALKGKSSLVYIRDEGKFLTRRGDWVLEIRGRSVKCPAVIAEITGSGRYRFVWLYRPIENIQSISLKRVNENLRRPLPEDDDYRIPAARATKIWELFPSKQRVPTPRK